MTDEPKINTLSDLLGDYVQDAPAMPGRVVNPDLPPPPVFRPVTGDPTVDGLGVTLPPPPLEFVAPAPAPAPAATPTVTGAYAMTLEEAAQALQTIKLVPDNADLDPKAVRAVPRAGADFVGVLTLNDAVLLCWDHVPTPQEVVHGSQIIQRRVAVGVTDGPSTLQRIREAADKFYDLRSDFAEDVIQAALDDNATDIHLAVGALPKIRSGGRLRPIPGRSFITTDNMQEIIRFLIAEPMVAEFNKNHDVDASTTYAGWRMRISLYQQKYSPALAIRIIPRVIPELEDLGVPPIVLEMLTSHSQGMFLVCGVTGSGKSTTLAAGLNNLNRDKDLHILTLEDPIEYVHEDRRSTVHQREIGPDTNTFKTALRHALRQDPDVILVGEMRDYETMQMALEAAETGHLVLATVHSRDSGAVIKRLVASFPSHQQEQVRMQLADALIGVVIQKLIPAADSTTGRYLATEVMVIDDAIRNNIRENKLHMLHNLIEGNAGSTGSHTMDQSLAELVYLNKIHRETALREAAKPADFEAAYMKLIEGVRKVR